MDWVVDSGTVDSLRGTQSGRLPTWFGVADSQVLNVE